MNLGEDEERDLLIASCNNQRSNKILGKLKLSSLFKNNKNCSSTMTDHCKRRRRKLELFSPKLITACVVLIQLFATSLAQLSAEHNISSSVESGQSQHNSSAAYYVVRNPTAPESAEKRSPAFLNSNSNTDLTQGAVPPGMGTFHSSPNQMEHLPANFAPPVSLQNHQQINAPPAMFDDGPHPDDATAKGSQIINDSGKRRQYIPAFEGGFGPAMAPALPGGPPPPGPISTCPSGGPSLPVECDPKRPWPQCPPQSYCYATNTVDIGPYFCCPIWSTYGAAWRPATPFYNYAPPPPPNWPTAIRFADPVPFGPPRKSKKEPRMNDATSAAVGPTSDQIKIQHVVSEWTQRQSPAETAKVQADNAPMSAAPFATNDAPAVPFDAKMT